MICSSPHTTTAFDVAVPHSRLHLCLCIRLRDAIVLAAAADGQTALHHALAYGHQATVRKRMLTSFPYRMPTTNDDDDDDRSMRCCSEARRCRRATHAIARRSRWPSMPATRRAYRSVQFCAFDSEDAIDSILCGQSWRLIVAQRSPTATCSTTTHRRQGADGCYD